MGGPGFACRDDARNFPATKGGVGQLADLSSNGPPANNEANETRFTCTGLEMDTNGKRDTRAAFCRCVAENMDGAEMRDDSIGGGRRVEGGQGREGGRVSSCGGSAGARNRGHRGRGREHGRLGEGEERTGGSIYCSRLMSAQQ